MDLYNDMTVEQADAIKADRWLVETGLGPWWFKSEVAARRHAMKLRGVTWTKVKRG